MYRKFPNKKMDWVGLAQVPLMTCLIGLLGLLVISPGCDTQSQAAFGPPEAYPYKIVATTGMIADIVRQVAGDKAEVVGMMQPGTDPHVYKPTSEDLDLLLNANVIFYNGLHLEGQMGATLEKFGKQKPTHAVTELIDRAEVLGGDTGMKFDPHVWMNVAMWMKAVEAVRDKLTEYDPANAETYASNAEAYLQQLAELDTYARQTLATIPKSKRVLVTAHDAFGYMGAAYDIEVRGVQGISTEAQASLADRNKLVDLLVERKIAAIFVESSVSKDYIEMLMEDAQRRGQPVKEGGTLFSDAMGPAGSYEGTYIGMIDHNVTTITRALGGQAPQRGMQGKLRLKDGTND